MTPPKKRKGAAPASVKTQELFEAKLAESGLTLEDADRLGLEALDPEQVIKLHPAFANKAALKLNYYDAFGELMPDWPNAGPFYRLRYLGAGQDFKSLTGKQGKYTQVPDTVPCIYLPRLADWGDIMPDPSIPLVITEGELKAAAACKAGFPTVGLGGVWNFRSVKHGLLLLPSLAAIEWARRNVYIVFDSDLSTNQNVVTALNTLAEELYLRGAYVHMAWLPEVLGPDEKVGLDDFLVHHGDDGPSALAALLGAADQLGLVKPLFDLNERYVYVADPGLIIDQVTQAKHKPSALKDHLAAPLTVAVKRLAADGTLRVEKASAGAEWLKWPLRTHVSKVTYMPGKPRFTANGLTYYNTWQGWGIEPHEGPVKPFLALIDHLFMGAEPNAKQWFLRWLAYPLKYPGVKMFSSAVLHGRRHGTGKSLVGYTMSRIYGRNFTEIKQDDLHGNFNEWAENKQFVLGDDVTGSNKRQDNDVLKKLITQETIRVNPKYVPSYEVPDCINYLFTSNQPDAFFLEDDDRRFFIHEVRVAPKEEDFYVEYVLWLASGGASAVFHWLLSLELGGFNPAGHAYMTMAKQRMISDVRSDLGSWVRQLLEDPDNVLRVGQVVIKRELFTNRELLQYYDPTGKTGTTANGLGRELRRAGFNQILEGKPVRSMHGQDRYYAVRNQAHWETADIAEVQVHLEQHYKQPLGAAAPKY